VGGPQRRRRQQGFIMPLEEVGVCVWKSFLI